MNNEKLAKKSHRNEFRELGLAVALLIVMLITVI